ncbi:MAG: subunit of exonuclease SbcCD [Bacilli bacterium]|nr:subunit of exonuclease SbcCD [Bacilli bacterium]
MRILHTADWHLGRTLEGRSRQEEQEAFMDELVAIVRDEQIDVVLMAGDAYDSVNPPAAAEKLFYDGLARLADGGGRHVIAIAGNHDNPERLMAAAPLALRQGITLVGLPTPQLQRVDVTRTGERALLFALPYPSESRLRELLADEADEASLRGAYSQRIAQLVARQATQFTPRTVNLIMSHLYVLGGAESESERPIQVGGAYTVDTSALCANAQYVALGHLHRPQLIKTTSLNRSTDSLNRSTDTPNRSTDSLNGAFDSINHTDSLNGAHDSLIHSPDSLIRYSGSPLAYSFSEAGQAKSVTIIDLQPGGVPQWHEVYLSSGKPLVRWRATEGIAQVHRWLDEGKDARAWIDLELHIQDSLSMEQIQSLRKQHSGIIHIRPIYSMADETVASEIMRRDQLPIDEIFRRFYTRQTGGAQAEPALVSLFLELLQQSTDVEMMASTAEREE